MDRFGWAQEGNDWYIHVDGVDPRSVASGVAQARVTGQWRSITIDTADLDGHTFLHVNVPQAVLPSGVEIEFYMTLTMNDGGTVRVPATDTVTIRVTR